MKEELKKSLTDLIDETLLELEELKKSRYAAAEVEIKGPGEGIAGKPTNGDLHAKAEDKKHEDEETKEEEEKEEAKKAEGKNEEAAKAEGKNEEAAKAECAKKEDDKEDKKEDEDKEDEKKDKKLPFEVKKGDSPSPEQVDKEVQKLVRKSDQEMESLMKSFVEERVKPLEDKLSTILNIVNKIADQPIAPKGTTARAVPLLKSNEESAEMLSKSDVASKLFELKKSGTKVDSLDITRAEMGHDLQKIIDKYKIS